MFAMATMRGVHVVDATLSRPYLFFLTSIVAGTWGFLALCSVVWAALWILSRVSVKKDQNTERDPESLRRRWARSYPLQVHKNVDISSRITRQSMERMSAQLERALQDCSRTSEHDSRNIKTLTHITLIFTPLSFTVSIFGLSFSKTKESANVYTKQFFLIPRSNGSMSNLDQILALAGGVIILLAAIRLAYRSRMDREQTSGEVILRRRST